MRHVMVRYQVKPERVADNERLVRAVYAALDRERPDGLHYATFKLPDGVTFVHLAVVTTAENPLLGIGAFKEFTANIAERCTEPPVTTELAPVGSFRLPAGSST
jgi:hypothetical protein